SKINYFLAKKNFMKRYATFSLFSIILLIVTVCCQAQFTSIIVRNHSPNAYGNSATTYYQYNPPAFGNKKFKKTEANKQHTFTIILQNDSFLTSKTNLNLDNFVHTITYGKKDSKIIIRPIETKAIYRLDKNGEEIMGMPHDSCWLFLAIKGKIKAYSVTTEFDDPMIAYVQKGDGPLLAISAEILAELMADNEKALTLLSRNNIDKAIRVYNE
ncbi:MAG TPA: hypothetical protein VIY47_09825, partial [Ignavibacteriaceae bacterium]